jgi:regulatory protein
MYELRKKLLTKAEQASDVAGVMTKLQEYGFADDKKFSEAFAASRLANQGFGQFRVLHELRARRIAPSVADKAVAATFAETDEHTLAEQFLVRKYRGKDLRSFFQEEKNFASAYRRLRTAGFSSSASLSVLKRYSKVAEDLGEIDEPES